MNYNQTGSKPIVPMKWVITLTLLLALLNVTRYFHVTKTNPACFDNRG